MKYLMKRQMYVSFGRENWQAIIEIHSIRMVDRIVYGGGDGGGFNRLLKVSRK